MSSRAASVLRSIKESQSAAEPEPAKPSRRQVRVPKDPLPPEERAALRMLAEFEGVVGRSTMGPILDRLKREAPKLAICPNCVQGWVYADSSEEERANRAFEATVAAYAARALPEARELIESESPVQGAEPSERAVKARADSMGRDRALSERQGDPSERSKRCDRCDGSGLVPCRPPKRKASPQCPLCHGEGRVPGPRHRHITGDGYVLLTSHQPCRCLAETARPTGSSASGYAGDLDGPDPEWMARVGRQSRRMAALSQLLATSLESWYSPTGGLIECLWPLTEAGRIAIRGLLRDPRKWRATARVRNGGEALVRLADSQAEQLLDRARKAWMETLEVGR